MDEFIKFCNDEIPHSKTLIKEYNEQYVSNILEKISKIHFDFVKIHPFLD
jgi:Fic family protein